MRCNYSILKFGVLLLTICFLFASCKKEAINEKFKYGNAVTMGDGEAKTFVELDENNVTVAVGVKFTAAALENLPAEIVYTLEFPSETDVAPFNHVTIDWSDHGHDPPDVYDVPHFGFHFYYVSKDFRNGITANDSTEFALVPDLKYIPETFAQTPGGVPSQGAHWINTESPEWNGGTFAETFLYGTYNGEITFLEPMITMDYLNTKQNVIIPIKQPTEYLVNGYHPMSYTFEFDAKTNEYTIVLSDLIMRQ
ncbi:MAG: hypothetical protein ACI8P3_004324 [Saprospiraceae bacterium]|jgi:hypothetical protein